MLVKSNFKETHLTSTHLKHAHEIPHPQYKKIENQHIIILTLF